MAPSRDPDVVPSVAGQGCELPDADRASGRGSIARGRPDLALPRVCGCSGPPHLEVEEIREAVFVADSGHRWLPGDSLRPKVQAAIGSDGPASRVTVPADRAIADDFPGFLWTEFNGQTWMTRMTSEGRAHDAGK